MVRHFRVCSEGPAGKQTYNREDLDDWFRSYIDFLDGQN